MYALDFKVPPGKSYSISVSGPIKTTSPKFAVESPQVLYPGLLINTLFFYETQRDGPDFIPNALRDAPGHLKDKDATLYPAPPLDYNDFIDNKPPKKPLIPAGLPNINAEGGWWDAGDYEKYVETVSYTTALMEIGVRDFPIRWVPKPQSTHPHPPIPSHMPETAATERPALPTSAARQISAFNGFLRCGTILRKPCISGR